MEKGTFDIYKNKSIQCNLITNTYTNTFSLKYCISQKYWNENKNVMWSLIHLVIINVMHKYTFKTSFTDLNTNVFK